MLFRSDVFLLQAQGQRRWRWGLAQDDSLRADAPLKLLRKFTPSHEAVLEPGDMLYLPPGWAHEGVAIGECMTFSIGFRAPSRHELLQAWLADCADSPILGPDPRFGDAGAKPTRTPARVPDAMHRQMAQWLKSWRADPRSIDRFIGRFLTEPKPQVWFEAAGRSLSASAFTARLLQDGLRADRRSRLAYRGECFFINGECIHLERHWRALLRRLADQRRLEPAALTDKPPEPGLIELLRGWVKAGWVHLGLDAGQPRGRNFHGHKP